MSKKTTILLLLFSLSAFYRLSGQELSEKYTMKYINDRIAENCEVRTDDGYIVASFYRGNEIVREDYVYMADVKPEDVHYSESEKAIILTCFDKAGDCVDRNILVNGIRKGYNRVNLPTGCSGEDCKALVNAVRHLLYLYVLDDYERTKPFEED